jgi:hypothetical protein
VVKLVLSIQAIEANYAPHHDTCHKPEISVMCHRRGVQGDILGNVRLFYVQDDTWHSLEPCALSCSSSACYRRSNDNQHTFLEVHLLDRPPEGPYGVDDMLNTGLGSSLVCVADGTPYTQGHIHALYDDRSSNKGLYVE